MPFKSQAQRRLLYSKHPDIAKRWEKETPKGTNLPEHVAKKKAKIPQIVRKFKAQIQKYKKQK